MGATFAEAGFVLAVQQGLHSQIDTALRRTLVRGAPGLGSWVNEAEVARQMTIGRAPVPEAILGLEHDGLVGSVPRRGALVAGAFTADVDKVLSPRADLEARATMLAIGRLPRNDFATPARVTGRRGHRMLQAGNGTRVHRQRPLSERGRTSLSVNDRLGSVFASARSCLTAARDGRPRSFQIFCFSLWTSLSRVHLKAVAVPEQQSGQPEEGLRDAADQVHTTFPLEVGGRFGSRGVLGRAARSVRPVGVGAGSNERARQAG
jgi:hypothetical protein